MSEHETITFTIVLQKEDGIYCATVKEAPEVHTEGKTKREALEHIVDALTDLRTLDDLAEADIEAGRVQNFDDLDELKAYVSKQ